ncbi:MAG: hypothetical protein WBB31_04810, partial [Saprospiraceae bacterium]
ILATNMKNNIDDSFIRRFNSMLKFPFPESAQRAQIWRKAFPPDAIFVTKQTVNTEDGNTKGIREELIYVDIPDLVKKYEMSGGSIINVVHYAAIKAVERMELEPEIWKRIKTQKQITGKVNETTDRTIIAEKSQLVFFLSDVQDGVKREMTKEGKPFTI